MRHFDKNKDIKVIISFLVLAVSFGFLLIFWNYKDQIMADNLFNQYMVAVVIGMGLLLSLVYLVHNSTLTPAKKIVKTTKPTKKKKK